MRYVESKLKSKQQDDTYRIYLTDALKAISESASKFAGGQYMNLRYADLSQSEPAKKEEQEEDTRTAEEFARDVLKKAMKAR